MSALKNYFLNLGVTECFCENALHLPCCYQDLDEYVEFRIRKNV